jgi:hypothetical protein
MDPKKQTSEEKQQTLATTKAMKELKAHLKEMRQNNTGKSGVQGKEFNRKSIENMGPVSNKEFKDFKPDDPKGIPGALFGVASDKVKDVGSTLLSVTGLGGALGYMKTRNNIKRANKKHEDERQKIKDMLATAGKANTVGLEKLIAAFTKSYSKGKNSGVNAFDALIDTLINMGATTQSEIESLLETFSGGNYDPDALNKAIDAEVTGGGFGTKGSMLSKKLGGSSPSLSPSPVSNDAPFSYNPSSPLGGGPKKNSSSSPDERQIKLLTSILDVLDTRIPKPDKLQKKENRLEERRRKGREGGPVGAGEGEGGAGDGGEGGGGILDTLMDLAMVGSLAKGGRGGRGRRREAKARLKRMRGGRGKLGMLRRLGGFVGRNAGKVGALGAAAATGVAGAAGGLGGGIGSALSSAGSAVSSGGSAVGGWLSNAASWVGSKAGAVKDSVGNFAKRINPMRYLKSAAPQILPTIVRKIPVIGSAFETFFAGREISEIKADPTLSKKEKKQKIGKVIGGTMGSILGMVGAGALTAPLALTGWGAVGTFLAAVAGAEAGRWLGGKAADWIGSEGIYDLFSSMPIIGNMLSVDDEGSGSLTANTQSLGSVGTASSTMVNTAALVPNTSTPTLTNTTPSTIQSSQSNAAARSGSGGGNTIVAPSSSVDNSVVTTSNTNISSNPVGQGEASFVAAQYSNGSQRF